MSTTTYADVHVPAEAAPEDLTYQERRAELLGILREAGYPGAVNQSKLAEHYGVHRSTISRDIDAIREQISDLAGDRADLISDVIYTKSLRQFMQNGEYEKAINAVESMNEWLYARGYQRREPDSHAIATGDLDAADVDEEDLFLRLLEQKSSDGSRDLAADMDTETASDTAEDTDTEADTDTDTDADTEADTDTDAEADSDD